MTSLSPQESERYHRQLLLPEWDDATQQVLKKTTVFIAGAGGLGSAVGLYLAAAGIGTLRIADHDVVVLSNLNRQIIHDQTKLNCNKADSAAVRLQALNSESIITALTQKILPETIDKLVGESSLIIDCLDNFETRYLLNRFAHTQHVPVIYGSVEGWNGYVSVFHPPETPCLACVFPEHAQVAKTFPVIGVTPGIIGVLQATEALKHLTGIGDSAGGKILSWDGKQSTLHTITLRRNPRCTVCA